MKIVLDIEDDMIGKLVGSDFKTPIFNCLICPFFEEVLDFEEKDWEQCCFFGSKSMNECPVISVEGLYEKCDKHEEV